MKIEIIKRDVNNPVAEFFLTSTRSTPETDARTYIPSEALDEANKLSGAYEDATNYYARIIELKEELDEARAVSDELAAIATRYLGWHLSCTPMGPDDDHLAQSRKITEAIARWKSLASA